MDENSEKIVLASLFINPSDDPGFKCTDAIFFSPVHLTLFRCLVRMHNDGLDGTTISLIADELRRSPRDWQEVGELAGLKAILDFTGNTLEWKDRQRRLLEFDKRRQRIRELSEELEDIYDLQFPIEVDDKPKKPKIEVLSPSEIVSYQVPPGTVLVGDNHITRGSIFVIGGSPSVGKSRASVALAEAGATGCEWFGLKVHCKFKTLIIQNENGRFRLKQEFSDLDFKLLDQYVKVTAPPPFGLTFDKEDFRKELRDILDQFEPGVVIIDPWNAAARDEKARNYQDTFTLIREVIPAGDSGPAIGIVAHTRKPQGDERINGRFLLNLLAGSYVLTSVPRTIFVMQHASDDVEETRVVWTCCKNNDGDLGKRSAWIRCNGLFQPLDDFDWEAWNSDGKTAKLSFETVPEIVRENGGEIDQHSLIEKLKEKGASKSAAYRYKDEALKNRLIKYHKGRDSIRLS